MRYFIFNFLLSTCLVIVCTSKVSAQTKKELREKVTTLALENESLQRKNDDLAFEIKTLQTHIKELEKRKVEEPNLLVIPCMDMAYDRPGEYLAGLGVSGEMLTPQDALRMAEQEAKKDVVERCKFLNITINEHFTYEVVCRNVSETNAGLYVGYVTLYLPIMQDEQKRAEELDVDSLDLNKYKKFREQMKEAFERYKDEKQ